MAHTQHPTDWDRPCPDTIGGRHQPGAYPRCGWCGAVAPARTRPRQHDEEDTDRALHTRPGATHQYTGESAFAGGGYYGRHDGPPDPSGWDEDGSPWG